MLIIHVVPTLGAGGTEHNALRLARAFNLSGGYQNMIVAMRPGEMSYEGEFKRVSEGRVTVLPEGRRNRLRSFGKLIQDSETPKLIFHFFNIDQSLMALQARFAGVQQLTAAAGTAAPTRRAIRRKWKLSLLLSRLANCPIVAASSWIERSIGELGSLPKGSRVVHNGIDVDAFQPPQKKVAFKPGSKVAFGMVARLDSVKDHETLLRGFGRFLLKCEPADASLFIIGDGPRRGFLENMARELGIQEHVRFLGTRTDIPELLHSLDAFTFSTRPAEGFGNVLVEAMAAGVPVLANAVPSSREVLQEGQLGTLVSNQTADCWAKSFEQFWLSGPSTHPPDIKLIKKLYGIDQFYRGYRSVLDLSLRKQRGKSRWR